MYVRTKIRVTGSILLEFEFERAEEFRELSLDFVENFPELSPETWNIFEPINLPWDIEKIGEMVGLDESGILWKQRAKPKGWCEIVRKISPVLNLPSHAQHALYVELSDDSELSALVKYLKHAALKYEPLYAFCDTSFPGYRHTVRQNGVARNDTNIFVFTHKLRRCLPDIFWAQIYGKKIY